MPAKTILSPGQRTAIFDPPTDRELVERFYTLAAAELVQVCRRRRGANRIGYAVQLCYLRHPGRALAPGETPPAAMLSLLCEQVGGDPAEFEHYAARGWNAASLDFERPWFMTARMTPNRCPSMKAGVVARPVRPLLS